MTAVLSNSKYNRIINELPPVNDSTAIYFYVTELNEDKIYIKILGELISLNDDIISGWLNITTRTFRNYKVKNIQLKDNLKEHIVSILSLYKHGLEVFDNKDKFEEWLISKNFLLDNKAPMEFMDTISGIRFIDNRLTAMEFGENV